ncbi:putative exocyst complex component [Phaeomoniella chlamydospora]|uniref:Exocyst complex component Sec8 n=1 Tax=Phaeomoniella chlamydospora TaxID=158046 RepID=A0A0G2E9G5_PHACM|nr:putative exocyst complex component [Phaeomoniella chlamydospora]
MKGMDEVLRYIQSDWSFMGKDDCIPVQVALQLMDNSSLGLANKEPDFQQTQLDLQGALKNIVNEHHQDFNSSIGTYHKIQNSLQSSQSRVRYLKNALAEAKGGLLTTKPELKGLATSSQAFDDTLQLFGQIESIQAVPEKLEARISEKRFLTAVDVLQDALRTVRRSDLDGIGGISDLRSYFSNQELSLTDILVEELHDHLYLKSPYCQNRWKLHGQDEGLTDKPEFAAAHNNAWERPVYRYLSSLDTSTPLTDDASRNVEADTFYYIHMLLESINKLGHLDTAVARIEQRLPVELFGVVEKTNAEVDAKHPSHLRGDTKKSKAKVSFPTDPKDGRGAVLSDFLWTLYSKFEAIAESHRVAHEVMTGIVAREKLPKPDTYSTGFKELWKLYQSEMRSLLHDYLATDGDMTLRPGKTMVESTNMFGRNQRDKSKRMFKLGEMDKKSASMKEEQDDLDEILKSSVPGLVSKSRVKAGRASTTMKAGQESSAAGHKLLIEPSVFNMTLLLPPSLAFLQHLKDLVPTDADIAMSTLTSFLDDFLINVFHPQLEETISELCAQSMIDIEAFTEDAQWSNYSPRPIFKGTVAFFSLVRSFSKMIDAIPHDQIFTQLVISQIVSYYDRCYGWYKALVTRLSPGSTNQVSLKAAAAYTESEEIRDITLQLLGVSQQKDRAALVDKQISALINATNEKPVESYDIISDPKSVVSLALLHNSMQWLVSSLSRLRHITSSTSDSRSKRHSQSRRWTLISSLNRPQQKRESINQPVYLPMTSESVIAFDTTLQSLRDLGTKTLLTLQIDIRCGIIHMLTKALRGPITLPTISARDSSPPPLSSYYHVLPAPPQSASPTVLDLNNDLISFDTNTSSYFGDRERHFIINGLARLVDRVFVSSACLIQVMNGYGGQRLGLDILVLQQNLRNLDVIASPDPASTDVVHISTETSDDNSAVLYRSAKFFDLFLQGPEKVIEYAQEQKAGGEKLFSYDELKVLVELCFSEGLRSENREDAVRAKKGEGDIGLRLGEIMWDS